MHKRRELVVLAIGIDAFRAGRERHALAGKPLPRSKAPPRRGVVNSANGAKLAPLGTHRVSKSCKVSLGW